VSAKEATGNIRNFHWGTRGHQAHTIIQSSAPAGDQKKVKGSPRQAAQERGLRKTNSQGSQVEETDAFVSRRSDQTSVGQKKGQSHKKKRSDNQPAAKDPRDLERKSLRQPSKAGPPAERPKTRACSLAPAVRGERGGEKL